MTFDSIVKDRSLRKDQVASEFQDVLDADRSQDRIKSTKAYLKRLGADGTPAPLFANGVALPRDETWLQVMSQKIDADLRLLQRQVFEEVIPEDTWLAGQLLEKAIANRNALIIPEDENGIKIIDIGSLISKHGDLFGRIPRMKQGTKQNHPSKLLRNSLSWPIWTPKGITPSVSSCCVLPRPRGCRTLNSA